MREVNGVQGYDTSQGDLKGRFWYLRLGKIVLSAFKIDRRAAR